MGKPSFHLFLSAFFSFTVLLLHLLETPFLPLTTSSLSALSFFLLPSFVPVRMWDVLGFFSPLLACPTGRKSRKMHVMPCFYWGPWYWVLSLWVILFTKGWCHPPHAVEKLPDSRHSPVTDSMIKTLSSARAVFKISKPYFPLPHSHLFCHLSLSLFLSYSNGLAFVHSAACYVLQGQMVWCRWHTEGTERIWIFHSTKRLCIYRHVGAPECMWVYVWVEKEAQQT